MVPASIMLLYFYSHDALYDFYWSYIVYNIYYIGTEATSRIRPYTLLVEENRVFFLACLLMLILIYRKNRSSFPSAVIFLAVPFFFSGISGRSYAHYIVAVAPSAFILFSLLSEKKYTDIQILTFLSHHVGNYGRRTLLLGSGILVCISVALLIFFILQRFDMTRLDSLRASFRNVGLQRTATLLHLGNTASSSIYYLSETLPPFREFFPMTTMATGTMRRLLKNRQGICPEEKYDFLLLSNTQRLSPSCPYVPVTTEFKLGKLYKFSPPSSPDAAGRQE